MKTRLEHDSSNHNKTRECVGGGLQQSYPNQCLMTGLVSKQLQLFQKEKWDLQRNRLV